MFLVIQTTFPKRDSKHIQSSQPSTTMLVKTDISLVFLSPTCVRRARGGGVYDCGAIICHAELASSLRVQRREEGRPCSSVSPIGPPRELQVQGLVKGEHGYNLLTSHLHKQPRGVTARRASERYLGFLITTLTMKGCIPE